MFIQSYLLAPQAFLYPGEAIGTLVCQMEDLLRVLALQSCVP